MKNPNQTTCDACLNVVAGVLSLNDYAGDLVCDQCMADLNEMIEDHFEDDFSWAEAEADAHAAHYDDDPNPYHGTYSEM